VELRQRKELLSKVVTPTAQVRLLDHFEESGELVYEQVTRHGFEGVVAKKSDSFYEAGNRSRKWVKIKHVLTDDFIVGDTPREGAASQDLRIAAARFQGPERALIYSGNVGTGFDEAMEASVLDVSPRCRAIRTRSTARLASPKPSPGSSRSWSPRSSSPSAPGRSTARPCLPPLSTRQAGRPGAPVSSAGTLGHRGKAAGGGRVAARRHSATGDRAERVKSQGGRGDR